MYLTMYLCIILANELAKKFSSRSQGCKPALFASPYCFPIGNESQGFDLRHTKVSRPVM